MLKTTPLACERKPGPTEETLLGAFFDVEKPHEGL
jgi:hypothetical protein